MTTAELLNPNAAEHTNMEGDSQMLQDFYIISKEPDTGPIVVGMVIMGGVFCTLFVYCNASSSHNITGRFLDGVCV